MKDIYLHGDLAEKFVPSIKLNVTSIPEALRALEVNFSEFRSFVLNYKPGFYIRVGTNDINSQDELILPLGKNDKEIHIIPAIGGSGKYGIIILGAVLMWASGGLAGTFLGNGLTSAAGSGGLLAAGGTIANTITSIGMGLVLSGISAVLFAPPKPTSGSESAPNKYFNGIVNTTDQGNPVPIGYGELIVGSSVISAGLTIDNSDSIAHAKWLFTEVDKDGWVLSSPNVYYNNNTHITWDSINGLYYHTTTKNVDPGFYGITCTVDDFGIEVCTELSAGSFEVVVPRPPSTLDFTYSFDPLTGKFKRVSPDCSVFYHAQESLGAKPSVYCDPNGSSVMPEEWGT